MAVNIEKIKICFLAGISWLKRQLCEKYPLWLFFVVFLVAALFVGIVSCSHEKASTRVYVAEFDYMGHTYVTFYRGVQFDSPMEVLHSPDCICYLTEE